MLSERWWHDEACIRACDPRCLAANRAHLRRSRRPSPAAYPADVRAGGTAEHRSDRRGIDPFAHRRGASSARVARGRRAQAREDRAGGLFLARRDDGACRAGGGAGLSGGAPLSCGLPGIADRGAPMAEHSQFQLLRERRFAPFFWTQFLGAANDNVYKNALVIFVAFHAASLTALDPNALVNIAGAVFIAPFMLLSATGGQLADKYEKSRLIRYIKLFEIAIMVIGLAGFWQRSLALLFVALALMGIHSTLFGPVKYAILPQMLAPQELVGGNGLVAMGTFVAILLGTIAGGLVVAISGSGPIAAGAIAIAIAVAGYVVSRAIPPAPAVDPALSINWNPITETWKNLAFARENRVVWRSMLGISWFWFYGAIFLAQFAGFSRDVLGGDETVVTALLALFSIGIGVGSLMCERMSGRKVEVGLVPFGSIGLTLFALDLWLASRNLHASGLAGFGAFFGDS